MVDLYCNNKDCENFISSNNKYIFGKCKRSIISIYDKGKCGYYFKKNK